MTVLISPVTTERAVGLIESANTISFSVAPSATKTQIKQEVEKTYGVHVKSVNTRRRPDGRKTAVIAFAKPGAATNLAGKLKIL